MASQRDSAKALKASRSSRTLSGSDKVKTAVDITIPYVENILSKILQPITVEANSWTAS